MDISTKHRVTEYASHPASSLKFVRQMQMEEGLISHHEDVGQNSDEASRKQTRGNWYMIYVYLYDFD